MFRLNFSHGTHVQHRVRVQMIRQVEREAGRPIAILLDLQGPKLRIGTFDDGSVKLRNGASFRLDLDPAPGNEPRAPMPHPEIFAALKPGTDLLLDDGKIRLVVQECSASFANTTGVKGGRLSERKGVNVPSVLLPTSAMAAKDLGEPGFRHDARRRLGGPVVRATP